MKKLFLISFLFLLQLFNSHAADIIPPTVVALSGGPPASNSLVVIFSESVTSATAENTANYLLSGPQGAISSATLQTNGTMVLLAISPPLLGRSHYTLGISNVQDTAAPANTLSPNPTVIAFDTLEVFCTNGVVKRDVWFGLNPTLSYSLSLLTNDFRYPDAPDQVDYTSLPSIEHTRNQYNFNAGRLNGYVTPSQAGWYQFALASDDTGGFWLSTDPDPAHKQQIINQSSWGTTAYSSNVFLVPGIPYYIEAMYENWNSTDYLRVQWKPPGAGGYSYIPAANLMVGVTNDFSVPRLVSAYASPISNQVCVTFSKAMADSVTNPNFFSITGGATPLVVTNAVLLPGYKNVALSLNGALVAKSNYTVTVSGAGVNDRTFNTNHLAPEPSSASFYGLTNVPGVVSRQVWFNLANTNVGLAVLTNDFRYPCVPDLNDFLTTFDMSWPSNLYTYDGARLRGYIVPSQTGSYKFNLNSDDVGLLSLSTDANPANQQIILYCRKASSNIYSAAISLQVGVAYYMEAIYHNTNNADYIHIQWMPPSGSYVPIPAANLAFASVDGGSCERPPDTNAPVLGCPASVSGVLGIAVTWTNSAIDPEEGGVAVTCIPTNGSIFPMGSTTVHCAAQDRSGNTAQCEFPVVVIDPPPVMLSVYPPPMVTARSVTKIQVVFNEPVVGVTAVALLMNGQPALKVSGSGAGPYIFTFIEPAPGVVQLAWAPGQQIYDLAAAPNHFAGGAWSNIFNPNLEVPIAVQHVVHISLDGAGAFYLEQYFSNAIPLPTYHKLISQGASTLNARCDYSNSVTLPNHASMFTGRPVVQPDGWDNTTYHGITFDADNGSTIHDPATSNPNVPYKYSLFDVAHDNGFSTAFLYSKQSLTFFARSWTGTNGAPDITGLENGSNKIDFVYNSTVSGSYGPTAPVVDQFVQCIQTNGLWGYTFMHFDDGDATGHSYNWGSGNYQWAITNTDYQIGRVLSAIQSNPVYSNTTILIITADHGGGDPTNSHTVATSYVNYRIPIFVFGPGVPAGVNLYDLMANRAEPGTNRYSYSDTSVLQPLRNGDTGNLGLSLLGLPSIPGSSLVPVMAEAVPLSIDISGGIVSVSWTASAPGQIKASGTLGVGASWQPITNGIITLDNRKVYSFGLATNPAAQFFRIQK
jgi:hypothetical protein